jgi:SAM-dependent methyltransferase
MSDQKKEQIVTQIQADDDRALKTKHRAIWGLGDYAAVAAEVIPSLGAVLVEACGIRGGDRVLDVAAGSGNAAIPAALTGASVVASDLTPELFDAGRRAADVAGVTLDWREADAEALPFDDAEFDVTLSCVGVMFAPHHQASADELVRVCRPGGTIAVLSWTPEGMLGDLFRTMKPFAPPPPPGAQPPPLWGSEEHLQALTGGRVDFHTLERDVLEITAFPRPHDYAEHFKAYYGPTIAARANAEREGRAEEFDAALDAFCDEWNRGGEDGARFQKEYLLAVGTRV